MISTRLSQLSAAVQFLGGLALLFASDAILPRLASGFQPSASWIGQLLGASWLALAALNWLHRRALLGGIYGRPVVFANFSLYFIGTTVLTSAARQAGGPSTLWWLTAGFAILAIAYGLLLFRSPVRTDLAKHAGG